MFLLRQPSPADLERTLHAQDSEPLSYPDPGVTRLSEAPGYARNQHQAILGSGADVYLRAVGAMRRWAMYALPWTHVYPPGAPVQEGSVLATVVHHLGFWSVNPCRVVYVDEQQSPAARSFAFAIGTLPLHSEHGEERFRVEWDRERDQVRFEILAYANPEHWMARMGAPYVRLLQRRFGREALRAVKAEVANTVPSTLVPPSRTGGARC